MALGAEMPESTLRSSTVAGAVIPLPADFRRSAPSPVSLFLFVDPGLVSSSIILKVSGLKMAEPADVSELDVFDFSNVAPYGLVQVNDFGVRVGKGAEKTEGCTRS